MAFHHEGRGGAGAIEVVAEPVGAHEEGVGVWNEPDILAEYAVGMKLSSLEVNPHGSRCLDPQSAVHANVPRQRCGWNDDCPLLHLGEPADEPALVVADDGLQDFRIRTKLQVVLSRPR